MKIFNGIYTNVKDEAFTNFFVAMGMAANVAESLLGTHWTAKPTLSGNTLKTEMTCQELPHLNTVLGGAFGEKVETDHPMFGFGGISTYYMVHNKDGEGLITICETEKCGTVYSKKKITMEHCICTYTGKGLTMTEVWERCQDGTA